MQKEINEYSDYKMFAKNKYLSTLSCDKADNAYIYIQFTQRVYIKTK